MQLVFLLLFVWFEFLSFLMISLMIAEIFGPLLIEKEEDLAMMMKMMLMMMMSLVEEEWKLTEKVQGEKSKEMERMMEEEKKRW